MVTAKLVQEGANQAVSLPEDFHFEGDRVYLKRVGNAVVLLPFEAPWQTLLDCLGMFSEDFMQDRAQPSLEERDDVFA